MCNPEENMQLGTQNRTPCEIFPPIVLLSLSPEQRSKIQSRKRKRGATAWETAGPSPINIIDDNLLRRILFCLNTTEIMYIVKYVCKRWYKCCKRPIFVDAYAWCHGIVTVEAVKRFRKYFIPKSIEHIDFSYATFEEASALEALVQDARPSIINLTCCEGLCDAHTSVITKICSQTTSLSLPFCSEVSPTALTQLMTSTTEIKALDLRECQVDSSVVKAISNCKKLSVLTLWNCIEIRDHDVQVLVQGIATMTCLDLSVCRNVTDKSLASIGQACGQKLIKLALGGCHAITDAGLSQLASCKLLTYLDLSWCKNITGSSVAKITESFVNLRSIRLLGCVLLNDESVTKVAVNCSNLRQLRLSDCPLLTDKSLDAVANHCKGILELYMSRCVKITQAGIDKIVGNCFKLSLLEVFGCTHLQSSFLKFLQANSNMQIGFDGDFNI
eukprot:m.268236 g.268236  ORF g.268236 m.268236 type:complete len:444 (+) comp77666_c0_seq1:812-2143(+)